MSPRKAVCQSERTYSMTTVAADFNNDGWTDLYVASDSTPSLFFLNQHNGTFTEEGVERGVAFSEDGAEQAGMGVAVGDYNLDGNLDIFKTHFSDDTNVLYRNDGSANFTDVTIASALVWRPDIRAGERGSPISTMMAGPIWRSLPAPCIRKWRRSFPNIRLKTPRFIFRNLGNGNFEELMEEAGPGIAARIAAVDAPLGTSTTTAMSIWW